MDFHVVRGFSPLNGLEIVKAMCGSLQQELQKHDYLSQNLAYPVVRWKITAEIDLGSSAHAQPETHPIDMSAGYEQTDEKGVPVAITDTVKYGVEVEHEVEFPDLSREQFIDEVRPKEPESATVAVAPTRAAMESYPEKFGKRPR